MRKNSFRGDKRMSAVDVMAGLVRDIAKPGAYPGEGAGRAIARAARRLGLPHRQTERLWNRDRKIIPSDLMDKAQRLANEPLVEEARHELNELDARLARIEALLVQDEDFMRPHADAFRASARRPDRPVD